MTGPNRRVAIVTGSGGMRGIGRAIALRFANAGLDIALVDIERTKDQSPEDEIKAGWRGIESVRDEIVALGRRAIPVYTDIADPAQITRACDQTVKELGSIDVLVNNARAIQGPDQVPVVDLSVAEWDKVMTINARGTFLFCQAVARRMIAAGTPGRIVNMSSIAGKEGRPNQGVYSASKFAINGLTQVLAQELGRYKITVNAICPGLTDSGRFNSKEIADAEKAGISIEEYSRSRLEKRSKEITLGRAASSEDIAGMAAFLISPDAAHITGQSINVDGGETFH